MQVLVIKRWFARLSQCFLLCCLFGAFSSNASAVDILAQVNVVPMVITKNQPFTVEVFVPMCGDLPDEDVHYVIDENRLTIRFKFDGLKKYWGFVYEHRFVGKNLDDPYFDNFWSINYSGCVGSFDPPAPGTVVNHWQSRAWRYYKVPVEGLSEGLYTVYLEAYVEDSAGNVAESVKSNMWAYFHVFEGQLLPTPDQFTDVTDFRGSSWSSTFYEGPAYKYHLETPKSGAVYSGIGLIRGWACKPPPREFTSIRYQIDDRPVSVITHGASRTDTAETCFGQGRNGFNTVINWNALGEGEHRFKLFFDDELVHESTFTVANLGALGAKYRTDLDATYELDNFPEKGVTTTIQWQAEAQNFVIVDVKPTP